MNSVLADALRRIANTGEESNARTAKLVGDLTALVESSNGAVMTRTKENLDQLAEQMAQAVGRNSQVTHASVKQMLAETGEMSRQNSERIAAVLERYQLQLERTESLGGELNRLAEQLRLALPQYSAVSKELHTVATETNTAAQRSKEAAAAVQDTSQALRVVQNQVAEVAKYSHEQVAQLAAAMVQTRESMT